MTIPPRFKALGERKPTQETNSAIVELLTEVWEYERGDYTFLYTRRAGSDRMARHRLRGNRAPEIETILDAHPPATHDVYFCPNAFSGPSNRKNWALQTRYAWSDIDDDDPDGFDPKPKVLWETSKDQFQGLWIWKDQFPPEEAEQFCLNVWQQFGGDKGAWSATKLLRVPGTINHKSGRDQAFVRLHRFDLKPREMPEAIADLSNMRGRSGSANSINSYKHDPEEVMQEYGRAMGPYARFHMRATRLWGNDRSGKVHLIIRKLMDAGADDDEVASVLRVNIYFTDKWGDDLFELDRQIGKIRDDWEADQ